MTGATRLFANLGAEEPDTWQRMAGHPRVRSVARLWAALFPSGARLVGSGAPAAPRLSAAFAAVAEEPAFPFCAAGASLVPWLATAEASALARAEGVPLAAAPPEVVRRVHDKAWAQAAAQATGLVPAPLAGASLVLAADELSDADAARCRIESAVSAWPEALRGDFTVKPRVGTSGRGRLAGRDGRIDATRLGGALARLRAAGGALVEPWLERTLDLSAQLHIAASGEVRVLGTLRQVLTAHGGPIGHSGLVDRDGSIVSGTRWDSALRAAALAIGGEASRAGFRGPCGLDALVFRASDGAPSLRPVVELNARYTAGTVALGHVSRAVRAGLAPDARAFYFGFAPAGDAWPALPQDGVDPLGVLADDRSVRLCLVRDAAALDALLSQDRRSP